MIMSRVRVSIARVCLKRTGFQGCFNTVHGNQDSAADAQHADFLLSYAVVDRPHTHAETLGGLCFRERYRATYFRILGRRRGGSRPGECSRSTSCRMVVRIASRTDFANSSMEKT
jgi:hypothetical protein